ncbi:DMT family transporter [Candidatus Bipolaricaulota bacterium]|nr:DMT family transporter [Candidatus Bipolaricaulota bacterium]
MTTIAILLATGAAIAWALETVLSKPALRHMDMFSYGAIRPLFALMFVVPYGLLTSGFAFPGWKLMGIAVVAGVIDSFVGSMLFYYAVHRVSAHEASSLANTAPFWGVITSILILGERMQPVLIVAAVFVVLGALFLVNRSDEKSSFRLSWSALPALGSGILWGFVETVPVKYCFANGMTAMTFQLTLIASSGIAWGIAALVRSRHTPLSFPRRGVALAFVTAILGYGFGWILWLSGVSMVPASLLSPVRGSMTLFTFLFSVILLHERPSRSSALGAVFVLCGVLLVSILGSA